MLRKRQILSAATMLLVASFSFSCETRKTEFHTGSVVQREQKYDVRRKQNDAAFLVDALNDVLLESQLAELAVRKATSPHIKEFAISVLTDHSIAEDEIREMASRLGVDLPDDLPAEHKRHYVRIAKMTGPRFERAFCDFLSIRNTVALKKFERIAQDGSSDEIRNWAWGKLGILKRHIALAESIESGGPGTIVDTKSFIE